MAAIIPFQGIVYNPELAASMDRIVAPPYDVISPEEQDALYQGHDKNVVRLILNRAADTDTETDNPHTRSGKIFRSWLAEGTLIRDEAPALYLTAQEFTVGEETLVRLGLIARVRLETFDSGVVRPHEKTFSKVKSERLSLMKQCHTNYSPIFSLYPDEGGDVFSALADFAASHTPALDFAEPNGQGHRLWKITDKELQGRIVQDMKDRELFIADGHHRYETALNYLGWRMEQEGELPGDHPARFVMMYLSSMSDPGLVILPAHRMLASAAPEAVERLFNEGSEYFEIETLPYSESDFEGSAARFAEAISAVDHTTGIGVVIRGENPFRLMVLKAGAMDRLFADEIPHALRKLDVTVLTNLVFQKLLGLTAADLDDHDLISYTTDPIKLARSVRDGQNQMGFIINPSRIEEVGEVAHAGLTMPRKSTYFFPKVITGLVMNDLKG